MDHKSSIVGARRFLKKGTPTRNVAVPQPGLARLDSGWLAVLDGIERAEAQCVANRREA